MAGIEFSATGETAHISGDLNFASVTELYTAARQHGLTRLRQIDLREVGSIDSAGLALLLELSSVAKRQQHRLAIEQPPKQLLRLAQLSNAADHLGL